MIKKISALLLFILITLFLATQLLSPSQFDPAPFQPKAAPDFSGMWQTNEQLQNAELLAKGQVSGPEDVDQNSHGRIYAGMSDGRIIRFKQDASSQGAKPNIETFVNTGGRPLGLHFDASGNLIVADTEKGLLSVSPEGKITTLVSEVDGIPLGFTDDVDVAKNGIIYFSDASSKYKVKDFKLDIMEARPWGRLFAYNPATQQTKTLLKGLYFANGIALSKNEDFVLVNETSRYRITRYWLTGPKQGQSDLFIDNLPGFPDGISSNRQGQFWLAIPNPRNASLDAMHPYPLLKKLATLLPEALQPQPVNYGFIVALNEKGQVLLTLQDTTGQHLHEITSVQQVGNSLLIGSLHGDRIGRINVPAFPNIK